MKKIIHLVPLIFLLACDLPESEKVYIWDFSGNVTLNGKPVRVTRLNIKYGDIIETGANSGCDIIINEKNIIRIKENSRLVYRISSKESVLQVDRGWLASVIRKKFTGDGKLYITTPALTATIAGTSFCMKIENPTSCYFCVCNGTVTLSGTDRSTAEAVTAAGHIARRFSIDKKSGYISIDRSPGTIYHDSRDIDEIAGIINEKIDWNVPDAL